jgi:hypothetical protein
MWQKLNIFSILIFPLMWMGGVRNLAEMGPCARLVFHRYPRAALARRGDAGFNFDQ